MDIKALSDCEDDRPVALDLCCGLGGWTEGLIAEGWRVIGIDIEDMFASIGEPKPSNFELVVQSIMDTNGADYAHVGLIVASPPCQEFSYMAMPWGRAKQIARALRGEDEFPEGYKGSRTLEELNALFDACFRIQLEASEVAGRHIPMVVENVKGAQPWVGRAPWSFGSFFLWGDIPALMPIQRYHERLKVKAGEQWNINRDNFTGTRGWDEGVKNPGFRVDGSGGSFQTASVKNHDIGRKNNGGSWLNIGSPGQKETGKNPVHELTREGIKQAGLVGVRKNGKGSAWFQDGAASASSASSARKAASAKIAKIPEALSRHIAKVYLPEMLKSATAREEKFARTRLTGLSQERTEENVGPVGTGSRASGVEQGVPQTSSVGEKS